MTGLAVLSSQPAKIRNYYQTPEVITDYRNNHTTIMTMTSQATATAKPQTNQIVNTISWTLNVAPQRLLPYTHFVDDLHLDDVDLLLLIAALENHHKVYLTPEQVNKIETVADATRYFSVN